MRKLLLTILALLALGGSGAWAQRTVTAGSQVTDETNLVSGRAYLLQHQGNGNNTPWIEDADTYYNCPNSAGNRTEKSVWYLYDNGDGTWKIKNLYTNMYWPQPNGNANLVGTDEENAGRWTLNFSGGVAAPTCNGYCLNRNTPYLVGWNSGSGTVTQVKIFEVNAYETLLDDLQGKVITVGDAVSSFTTDTWYMIKCNHPQQGSYYRGSIFETPGALYHNGNTSMDKSVKWLFRFQDAGETDKYYVETAYGNYWTDFTDNAQIGTRTPINGNKEKITIAKINNTDGHFYFKSETTGVIMDAAGLISGTASGNVVGWSTTTPTATGGNNDWGIYEVSITDFAPTASEIYTINNTNSGRGAIMYAPAVGGSKWVWVGGLDGAASFDTNNANFQWIFYPTGKSGQYYLYNVGYQKFIVPVTGGTFDGLTWAFSSDAVPVSLESQSDGTYKIYTSTGSKYISVSTAKRGPVIDYNDVGAQFTITKVADASDAVTTQLTTAVSKLIISQTALTEAPTVTGWYAIRIKTNNDSYKGYIYTLSEETSKNGNSYPLGWYSECDIQPAINNGSYIVKLTKSLYGYYYQMPNGKYIQNGKLISGVGESSIKIAYTDENHFTLETKTDYFRPYNITGYSPTTYFIGETATAGTTYYDIYPISLESADLNAWSVTINGGAADATLTCSRADVSGLSTVYNNGYFFLPTGVTPAASDFTGTGLTVTIDSENKTITAYHYQNLITTYLTNNGIKAKMDLAGTAVGYPKEDATESANLLETYVKIAVNAQYTADVYSELQTRYPAYLASTDIVLPTDGKVYTFTSVQKDGTTIKVYHNTSNNELALTSSALDDGSDKFVCHAIDASQRQFAFVSLNGRYMVGATGSNGKTMSETYSAAKQMCTISKHGAPNDISKEQAFGKVSIKFNQRVNHTSVAVLLVNSNATWNGYDREGVTDAYSSMFTLTEVPDYYNAVTMHVASDGNAYATVYLPFAATVPTGVRAFYASGEETSSLTMTEITGTIPANTAVVLVSENAAATGKIYLSPAESAGTAVNDNKLTGTVTAGQEPAAGKTMCVFGDSNGNGPGFYKSKATTIPLGKAVYMAPQGSGVKSLNFGTTTVGISEVAPQTAADAPLYDLSGRRVASPTRGIYVRGGRKVVVR